MTQRIPFVKMHGLGNDFVIIETKDLPINLQMNIFASQISDRRFGIGCDQFITYNIQENKTEMNIYNQDGSRAKICGNALRCLGRLLFDKKAQVETVFDVSGRDIFCYYFNEKEIQVNMGAANFQADWMIDEQILWQIAGNFAIDPKELVAVDMGNPHLVIFANLSDRDQQIIGELFQKPSLFKDGVNVNFAQVLDDTIKLKVWERGTGFTLACGSGACASYAAASKLGFVDGSAKIQFMNGSLNMNSKGEEIIMTGPAEYVFTGEYLYG